MIPEAADLKNPYPGLRPFEASDAEYFFGRDRQVDDLLVGLRDHRFVAVLGMSGSGKSSLVRAGLIPALKAGHLTCSGSRWRVALFRPGSQPLEALAAALDEALGAEPGRLANLRTSTNALLLKTRAGREGDESLLVVVDQFEEIFRVSDIRDATHFVDLLVAAEQDVSPSFRVCVVLTMRTNHLGECARFEGLPEALNRSQYLVPRLASGQVREVIEGPAALTDTAISPELAQKLAIEGSGDPDQLPLLQHLLMTLWERRKAVGDGSWLISLDEYTAVRSAADALTDHADRVLSELPQECHHLASLIFRALTQAIEGRDQRRPLQLSKLANITGASPKQVHEIVEHFRAASLLTSPDRERTPDWEADITHESLIRRWKKLAAWVDEEVKDAEDYRDFSRRAGRAAGPLTGLDLDLAVQWLDKGHNAFWAARYGGDFDATVRYIRESQKARAEAERILAEEKYLSSARVLALAALGTMDTDPEQSLLLATEALARTYDRARVTTPEAQNAIHRALQMSRIRFTLRCGPEPVNAVCFGANSLLVAAGSASGEATVWSTGDGTEIGRFQTHSAPINGLVFSPGKPVIFTASADGLVLAWDAVSGRILFRIEARSEELNAVDVSADGGILATAGADGTAKLWSASDGRYLKTIQKHHCPLNGVVFGAQGTTLATASSDGFLVLFDDALQGETCRYRAHDGAISRIAFGPGDIKLATADAKGVTRVWDRTTKEPLKEIPRTSGWVGGLSFARVGERLAVGYADKTVRLFDPRTGAEQLTLAGHQGPVNGLDFSSNGDRIASSSADGTVKIWDVSPGGQDYLTISGFTVEVNDVVFLGPQHLAAASADGTVSVWSPTADDPVKPVWSIRAHSREINGIAAFSRGLGSSSLVCGRASLDGLQIATASADKTSKIFDLCSGHEIVVLSDHGQEVNAVAWDAAGMLLATASADWSVRVWDVSTGRCLHVLWHHNAVNAVAFHPREKLLAGGDANGVVTLWSSDTGKPLEGGHFRHPPIGIRGLAFNADGSVLATAAGDVRLWSTASRQRLRTLTGHVGLVNAVAFSLDPSRLASTGEDRTVRIWNTETGEELMSLVGHTDTVKNIAFAPDGRFLATASADRTVRIYALNTDDLLRTARSRVTRSLSEEERRKFGLS